MSCKDLSVPARLEGLGMIQLQELKRQCEEEIKRIEEGGKVEMWVVSTDWLNLHWDTSYERACLFLADAAVKGACNPSPDEYALRPDTIYASEFPQFEADYGKVWADLQKRVDAAKEQA